MTFKVVLRFASSTNLDIRGIRYASPRLRAASYSPQIGSQGGASRWNFRQGKVYLELRQQDRTNITHGLFHKADIKPPDSPCTCTTYLGKYEVLPSRYRLEKRKDDQDMYPLGTRQRRLASGLSSTLSKEMFDFSQGSS